MKRKNIYSKEFMDKFNEFKELFYKASDVFDELYEMARSNTHIFDDFVMISSKLSNANRWICIAENEIQEEKNNDQS